MMSSKVSSKYVNYRTPPARLDLFQLQRNWSLQWSLRFPVLADEWFQTNYFPKNPFPQHVIIKRREPKRVRKDKWTRITRKSTWDTFPTSSCDITQTQGWLNDYRILLDFQNPWGATRNFGSEITSLSELISLPLWIARRNRSLAT